MPRLIQIQRPSTRARDVPGAVDNRKPPELSPAAAERLRQYASSRTQSRSAERCEFCGADIDARHGHVVDLPRRALLCVCRPCYLLFTHDGAGGARFRAVPERYALLPDFAAARAGWEALQIPIGLAFFCRNSASGRTHAFYPSPAGATECELTLDAWDDIVRAVPALGTLASDVEALLVWRRDSGAPHPEPFDSRTACPELAEGGAAPPEAERDSIDALIVPIDVCYELVGRIRLAWRGFQGGDDVWREIGDFFSRAAERANAGAV